MSHPIIKSYVFAADIAPYLIAKAAAPATGTTVTAAAAATDPLIGVTDSVGGAAGKAGDVTLAGLAELRLGGTVAFRDPLTADASGRAVKAVPTTGATVAIIAWAGAAGVEGDIIPVLVAPSLLHKPA